jgi:RNA polymerase sigma-70 factor, ECF subfamily
VPHLKAAYNLARWLLRNEAEAEDAVQDAYLRALEAFKTFRGGDGRSWLLTIVRHCCYDRLRRNIRFDRHAPLDDDMQIADGGRGPEGSMLRGEQLQQIDAALLSLSPSLREVLILREMEEMSYDQIAKVIDAPLGTVMSRLNRARRYLRQNFGAAVTANAACAETG